MTAPEPTFWVSYGGGVNSTALAILLVQGRFPRYAPWRIVFADTGNERDETLEFIERHFAPWLERHGKRLETVHPRETVLERWQRFAVTGSRIVSACTMCAKIRPIDTHIAAEGGRLGKLIGIDAGERHRAHARFVGMLTSNGSGLGSL